MSEHVSSFRVGIICNDKAIWYLCPILMQILQYLDRLRPWSCAHIEAQMIRLDVQKSHWYHRHSLLPEYPTVFCLLHQKLMKILEQRVSSQLGTA